MSGWFIPSLERRHTNVRQFTRPVWNYIGDVYVPYMVLMMTVIIMMIMVVMMTVVLMIMIMMVMVIMMI